MTMSPKSVSFWFLLLCSLLHCRAKGSMHLLHPTTTVLWFCLCITEGVFGVDSHPSTTKHDQAEPVLTHDFLELLCMQYGRCEGGRGMGRTPLLRSALGGGGCPTTHFSQWMGAIIGQRGWFWTLWSWSSLIPLRLCFHWSALRGWGTRQGAIATFGLVPTHFVPAQ